tara:strand:- start:2259 stop:3293 length:1035 start_codon:yes stop_codon:yes gene_type:complete
MKFIITGGAGFIGSSLIRYLINETEHQVLNIDKLTYAGNLESLETISHSSRYQFSQTDICDQPKLDSLISEFQPNIIMHLAAESHVDRSIEGPAKFIETNIVGTYKLLEAARTYWHQLEDDKKNLFRFHHISTDEVYGDLEESNDLFREDTPYKPSSPYSASKASSDHLVRSWHRTFGLPIVITNCSNNYGPYHFPEKLIPQAILNALFGKPILIYGNGNQTRDWLYVDDHASALVLVATNSIVGETYNIGGRNEKKNIEVVDAVCELLEELQPVKPAGVRAYKDLITFIDDRPGHDFRYAIDAGKIERDLGWKPKETFESGIRKTVLWYLENTDWWKGIVGKE